MAFTAQQSFTLNSGTTPALSNSAAATVTFGYASNNVPIRYAYIAVENNAGFAVFVRTDGTAATNAGGDFNTLVPSGTTAVIANALAWWSQAASVIPASTSGAGAYTVPSGSGPSEVVPMGSSPYGQTASPGTSVSIIAISGSTPGATTDVTITGTG
jgi:hypothetical protein